MVTDDNCTYHGEHWAMCRIVKSLWSTLVTNITLYVNYTSIKKMKINTGKRKYFLQVHDHRDLMECINVLTNAKKTIVTKVVRLKALF